MSNVLIERTDLENIADAIRLKNGTENTYKVRQMASAINNLPVGQLQSKDVTITSSGTTTVEPDTGYDGLSDVDITLNTETKTVKSTTSQQTINPTTNKFIDEIIVEPMVFETKTVKSTTTSQTINPTSGKDGISEITVQPISLQNKTVTPTSSQQTIIADNGYDGLGTVTVEAGGGSTPVLEQKSISITSNGSYSVTYDDENYDGLDDVAITVNVTGVNDYIVDFSTGIGYNFVPDDKVTGYNYAKTIKANWDNSVTTMLQMYQGNTNLVFFPLVDTSNVTNISRAFYNCSNLEVVPLLDTSNCVGCNYTFNGCTNLKTVPQFDFSKTTAFSNTFKSCSSLTDESLNNILAICINATAFMQNQPQSNWTLKIIGLSSSQATRCQSLSNWNNFVAAGWTSGY